MKPEEPDIGLKTVYKIEGRLATPHTLPVALTVHAMQTLLFYSALLCSTESDTSVNVAYLKKKCRRKCGVFPGLSTGIIQGKTSVG